jgi:hypothetical protein
MEDKYLLQWIDPQWAQPGRMAHRQAIHDLATRSVLLCGTASTLLYSSSKHTRIVTSF